MNKCKGLSWCHITVLQYEIRKNADRPGFCYEKNECTCSTTKSSSILSICTDERTDPCSRPLCTYCGIGSL